MGRVVLVRGVQTQGQRQAVVGLVGLEVLEAGRCLKGNLKMPMNRLGKKARTKMRRKRTLADRKAHV